MADRVSTVAERRFLMTMLTAYAGLALARGRRLFAVVAYQVASEPTNSASGSRSARVRAV
jgi:hypothetical protein